MKTACVCLMLTLVAALAHAQDDAVRVGVVLPLSGRTADFGTEALRGINLAAESVNSAGGVDGHPIKLIVRDNAGEPAATSQSVSEMIHDDGVVAVVGPVTSTNSAAAAAVSQQAKIPLVLPTATSPYVTEIGNYISRICFTDPSQSGVLAEFSRKHLKAEQVAIIYEEGSSYSEKLAEFYQMRFEDSGGDIVFAESFEASTDNLSELIETALREEPDILFAPVYYPEAAAIIKIVDALGASVTLLGGDGWESPELFRLAGDHISAGQVYISSHFSLQLQEEGESPFVERYRRSHGDAPGAVAALGYDATMLLADALRRATTPTADGLRQAIVSTSDFAGVTGTISINEKRNAVKDAYILKALKDRFVYETVIANY